MPLEVLHTTTGYSLLLLSGDFDMKNALEVDAAFESVVASGRDVIVDLSAVAFLDSMLLRRIAQARERAHGLGRHLVLVRPDPIVWRVFTVTRLDAIIPSAASLPEAEQRLDIARAVASGDHDSDLKGG